jgi:predicted transposase
MKTIKLPYKTTENLEPILRQYSSVVRYAYNRFYEGMEKKEVIHSVKTMNHIDLLVH